MRPGMGMSQQLKQSQQVSQSLVMFTKILALSGQELHEYLHREIDSNPALSLDEHQICPACGDPLKPGGACFRCNRGEGLDRQMARDLIEHEDPDDTFDPLMRIAAHSDRREHLLRAMAGELDGDDLSIAEYLIGELDERGFLTINHAQAAGLLDISEEHLARLITILQSVGPLGIGASDARECLLIQLAHWESLGEEDPLARRLLESHFDSLGKSQFGQLARELNVSQDEILAARDFIRSHLRPYPIAERADMNAWEWNHQASRGAPDVIVRMAAADADEEFVIEVVESRRYQLAIDPMYRDLESRLNEADAAAKDESLSEDDRTHILAQVQRAQESARACHRAPQHHAEGGALYHRFSNATSSCAARATSNASPRHRWPKPSVCTSPRSVARPRINL